MAIYFLLYLGRCVCLCVIHCNMDFGVDAEKEQLTAHFFRWWQPPAAYYSRVELSLVCATTLSLSLSLSLFAFSFSFFVCINFPFPIYHVLFPSLSFSPCLFLFLDFFFQFLLFHLFFFPNNSLYSLSLSLTFLFFYSFQLIYPHISPFLSFFFLSFFLSFFLLAFSFNFFVYPHFFHLFIFISLFLSLSLSLFLLPSLPLLLSTALSPDCFFEYMRSGFPEKKNRFPTWTTQN